MCNGVLGTVMELVVALVDAKISNGQTSCSMNYRCCIRESAAAERKMGIPFAVCLCGGCASISLERARRRPLLCCYT